MSLQILRFTICSLQSDDYTTIGALAQLGAHHTGSVGVRGSNPLCSTNEKSLCLAENIGFIFFCYALKL